MFRKGKALGELGYYERAEKVLEDLKTKNPSGECSYAFSTPSVTLAIVRLVIMLTLNIERAL